MKYPPCFHAQGIYKQWKRLAVIANETVSPCSDCTTEYEQKMHSQGLCTRERAIVDFLHTPRKKYKPRKKHLTGNPHE